MRCASSGSMSSTYSGNTHLRIERQQEQAAEGDGNQADEAQLSVAQIDEVAKGVAPDTRSDKRQQTLEDQHERARRPERFRHPVSPSGWWRLLARAGMRHGLGGGGLLQILEEFGTRIEDHQVALVLERRLVGLE